MTNKERVLSFLQSIAPKDASNSEIVGRTGIRPHQQIFMITRDLMQSGSIKGVQAGHEWRFWCGTTESIVPSAIQMDSRPQSNTHSNLSEPYDWDTADSLDCRIAIDWVKLGRVGLQAGRLRFPKAPFQPGLYRFRVQRSDGGALYFGESVNLARRFALYATPAASQQTNLRLNERFCSELSNGSQIAVAVVTAGAWIEVNGNRDIADFRSKAIRRLFEHAAIAASAGEPVESLNR